MLIQKLRLQRGWSQQQLADFSGLSTRTIQRLENGQHASIESLKSLAAVFEVDFQTLQGEPTMSPAIPATAPVPESVATASASRDEEEALQYVRKLKGFYRSLLLYALVIPLLTAINAWHSPQHWWVIWPALGWGLGLLVHAIQLFGTLPFFGPQWERQQVEKRLGRKL